MTACDHTGLMLNDLKRAGGSDESTRPAEGVRLSQSGNGGHESPAVAADVLGASGSCQTTFRHHAKKPTKVMRSLHWYRDGSRVDDVWTVQTPDRWLAAPMLRLKQEDVKMTLGKGSLLAGGLVAMFALGVESGPAIRDSWPKARTPESAVAKPVAGVDTSTESAPVTSARPVNRKRVVSRVSEPAIAKKPDGAISMIAVSLWEPQLRNRVKTVLSPGSQLDLAAADFDSSEQFITVAHAARNTSVPFVVLKDRVLNQGQSLADAIREFNPELDAKAEAARARSEARSDLNLAG